MVESFLIATNEIASNKCGIKFGLNFSLFLCHSATRFGETWLFSKVFDNFKRWFFSIGPNLESILSSYSIEQNFDVVNGQILEKQSSHLVTLSPRIGY